MTARRSLAAVGLCVWAGAAAASAQQIADDAPEQARMRLGPVGVTPSVSLSRFGIDTNVFNEFDEPRRDFTFTLSPQIDAWARAGRSRFQIAARSDFIYFKRYASERSIDGALSGRLEVPGRRFVPWVAASYASGRQRIGYDVDLRFRRTVDEVSGGVDAQLGGRSRLGVGVQRNTYEHDPDAAVVAGSSLRDALDRRSDSVAVRLQYALTPLTTVVISGQAIQDRFDFTPARDADSTRVDAGFDLAPFALISGRGRIGFRKLTGVGGGLPGYSGLVASVAAASTIGGRTRIEVSMDRDVTYSWESHYPYFILTGVLLTATPRLSERWDLQGRLGGQRLAYRPEVGGTDLLRDRVDTYSVRGAGIGYHFGRDLRLGFNVDRERRTSPVRLRFFEGYRAGISVNVWTARR
jgi:hypothetical protein